MSDTPKTKHVVEALRKGKKPPPKKRFPLGGEESTDATGLGGERRRKKIDDIVNEASGD